MLIASTNNLFWKKKKQKTKYKIGIQYAKNEAFFSKVPLGIDILLGMLSCSSSTVIPRVMKILPFVGFKNYDEKVLYKRKKPQRKQQRRKGRKKQNKTKQNKQERQKIVRKKESDVPGTWNLAPWTITPIVFT